MVASKFLGLTVSERDLRIMYVLVPLAWVVLASGAYLAFTKGNVGEGIGHSGLLLVLFSGMVGPHFWRIVDDTDITLNKVLRLMSVFGLLTMATGWLIRFTT